MLDIGIICDAAIHHSPVFSLSILSAIADCVQILFMILLYAMVYVVFKTTYNIYMRLWRCELMIYGDIVEHCRSININKRDYAEGKRSELIFCVCRESEPYVNWGK